jgi:hypothetical protein
MAQEGILQALSRRLFDVLANPAYRAFATLKASQAKKPPKGIKRYQAVRKWPRLTAYASPSSVRTVAGPASSIETAIAGHPKTTAGHQSGIMTRSCPWRSL